MMGAASETIVKLQSSVLAVYLNCGSGCALGEHESQHSSPQYLYVRVSLHRHALMSFCCSDMPYTEILVSRFDPQFRP